MIKVQIEDPTLSDDPEMDPRVIGYTNMPVAPAVPSMAVFKGEIVMVVGYCWSFEEDAEAVLRLMVRRLNKMQIAEMKRSARGTGGLIIP